mmetsp:Transcript_8606/g.18376  ORF Transcript_8606/g.18376 Transcript_8606/m.18376 type:complete len:286 (+) Transcript_8606:34-891(+)
MTKFSLSAPLNLLTRFHEPIHCRTSLFQQRRHFLKHLLVVSIQPIQFRVSHNIDIDQILLNGDHSELGKFKKFLRFHLLLFVRRFFSVGCCVAVYFYNFEQILNADTKITVIVEPGFVTRHHTFFQSLLVSPTRADAMRSLVYIECCSHSVASAMTVILSNFPYGFASEDIKYEARGILWKNHRVNSNVALEHTSIHFLERIRCFSQMPRPRNIRGTIFILPTGVNQDWLVSIKVLQQIRSFRRTVVNNCPICTYSCNCRETHFFESRLLCAVSSEDEIDLHLTH